MQTSSLSPSTSISKDGDNNDGEVVVQSDKEESPAPPVPSKEEMEEMERREKAIIRKVDWRLLPLLAVFLCLSLIDRVSLAFARTAGMDDDLGLSVGSRYSITTLVSFIPYTLLELPSNLFLRRLGSTNYLSFLVMAFGAVQISMGFVPSWGFLCLTRVLLGAFEAGFFPAGLYIVSTWYTRREVQTRITALLIGGVLVGGFTSVFVYVLTLLGGKAGKPAWSWIFIVEGMITTIVGIIGWFFLAAFPDQNTFLSPEETHIVLQRVEKDRGDSLPDALTKEVLVKHLLDWKLWAVGLMFMCVTMPAYAIGFFTPIILRGMGWNETAALLLTAPPSVFAFFSLIFFAWISSKYHQRAAIIAIQAVMIIIGMFMAVYLQHPAGRYAGIFLATAGSSSCVPTIAAYSSNNVVLHTKRAVSTAILVSFGGIGGVFGSVVFRQADFPTYRPGIYATIGCQALMLIFLLILTLHYWKKNKSIRDGTANGPLEGQPGFLYTL